MDIKGRLKPIKDLPIMIFSMFRKVDFDYLDKLSDEGFEHIRLKPRTFDEKDIIKILKLKAIPKCFSQYFKIIKPIINTKIFQEATLKNIHHRNKILFNHLIKVSYKAFLKAYRKKLNYRLAALGGLLHDFFIYNRYDQPKGLKQLNHGLIHGYIAYNNAKKYGFLDNCNNVKELEEIIVKHMWPFSKHPLKGMPKSKEAWIVLIEDKMDAIREYIL